MIPIHKTGAHERHDQIEAASESPSIPPSMGHPAGHTLSFSHTFWADKCHNFTNIRRSSKSMPFLLYPIHYLF